MNKEHLKRLTETERIIGEEGTSWCEVPEYFYEIGRSLLVHARADFGAEADAVEERLGELQKVRWDKIQSGKIWAFGQSKSSLLVWVCGIHALYPPQQMAHEESTAPPCPQVLRASQG